MAEKTTSVQIAPQVKLTLPILQEVNSFSRLNLDPKRVDETRCFSDPVLNVRTCNPKAEAASGEKQAEVCAIHWICTCYYGGRLGLGLVSGAPFNLEKAKDYSKTLTFDKLLEAIQTKLLNPEIGPGGEQAESIVQEQAQEQKHLQEIAASAPVTSKAAPKPRAPAQAKPQAIGTYNPGTLGFWMLSFLTVGTPSPKAEIWTKIQEKGWKNIKAFDKQLEKLVEEKLVTLSTPDSILRG
jgi:hypothetical protein